MNARASDEFHALIIAFQDATRSVNACEGSAEHTEEQVAMHRAIGAIETTALVATSYTSAIAALRAATSELDNFASSEIAKPLVKGALAFFENTEATSGSAPIHAMDMAAGLSLAGIQKDLEWLAIYDALNVAEEVVAAFGQRPACSKDDFLMSAAGEYIDTISEFLVWEKTRIIDAMRVAAAETRGEPELLNKAILAHDVKYSEFGFADIQPQVAAMSAQYDAYKARRAGQ